MHLDRYEAENRDHARRTAVEGVDWREILARRSREHEKAERIAAIEAAILNNAAQRGHIIDARTVHDLAEQLEAEKRSASGCGYRPLCVI